MLNCSNVLRNCFNVFRVRFLPVWHLFLKPFNGYPLMHVFPNQVTYLRQYVHSHWSIGVFRWEYANTAVTPLFLCFPGTISNHFKAISLSSTDEEHFSKFWSGDWPCLPLWARKQNKEEQQHFSCLYVSKLDNLVEGAQPKTTKYATKYAVNVFQGNFCI